MPTRYNIEAVPLQGGYVAKQCPVRAQNDAIRPAEPIPPGPFTERLFARGNSFEADVVADILRLHTRALSIQAADAEAHETATAAAMAACTSPILNARLPADFVGRRVGKPDVLVAAAGGGYRAVDIKWHQTLEPSTGKSWEMSGLCAGLETLTYESAVIDPDLAARKIEVDLLQLAHYQRMLESAGLAAAAPRLGGVIGTEKRVVWYDLDMPIWRTPSSSGTTKFRSTMERYDFEFDFRLDIVAVARQHLADPAVPLLVVPVRCVECPSCPWNDYCRPILESGSGDVSLLPRVGWTQWKIHRDHGVKDRATLAALDSRTAAIVAAGVDVAGLQAVAAAHLADTSVLDLATVWTASKQLAQLQAMNVDTVGDLLSLDAMTASYSGAGLTSLPEQIDLARAALGRHPMYRRRGVEQLTVPRADVEVDVDMESTELGAYLWGCLITRGPSSTAEYIPFVTWEPLTASVEPADSLEFWTWLTGLKSATEAKGLTFRAYCWNAGAENRYLRRIGLAWDLAGEVEAFIAGEQWVDMLRVWDSQLITGRASGLKAVAPLVGFRWDVSDPGGGESMVIYDRAIGDDSGADEAKSWLLAYNRNDVNATRAIREWLTENSVSIPPVESLDPRADPSSHLAATE